MFSPASLLSWVLFESPNHDNSSCGQEQIQTETISLPATDEDTRQLSQAADMLILISHTYDFPAYHTMVSAFPCCSAAVENIIISGVNQRKSSLHFSIKTC